jgi:hypothetical protein
MRYSNCLSLIKQISESQLGKYLISVDFIDKQVLFFILVKFLKEELSILLIVEEKLEISLVRHKRVNFPKYIIIKFIVNFWNY